MNKPVDFNDPKTQKPIKEDNSQKKKKEMTPGEKKERIKNIINKCVIAVLIIVILLLLLVRCDGNTGQPVIVTPFGNVQIGQQVTRPTTSTVPKNQGTITFAGYGKFNVDKDYPHIELRNPAQNYVNMYFAVYDEATGELIAQTEMVAPGQFAYVNVLEYYKNPGTYNVNIKTSTFDSSTNAPMNGMNQKMEVIIS